MNYSGCKEKSIFTSFFPAPTPDSSGQKLPAPGLQWCRGRGGFLSGPSPFRSPSQPGDLHHASPASERGLGRFAARGTSFNELHFSSIRVE